MPEGRVSHIFGGPTGERDVNYRVVSLLEDLLERAHSGEIVGVSVCALSFDGCGSYWLGGKVGGYSMLGAMDVARSDLVDLIRGTD